MGAQAKEQLSLPPRSAFELVFWWSLGVPQLNRRWVGEEIQAEDTAQRHNTAWLMQGTKGVGSLKS